MKAIANLERELTKVFLIKMNKKIPTQREKEEIEGITKQYLKDAVSDFERNHLQKLVKKFDWRVNV